MHALPMPNVFLLTLWLRPLFPCPACLFACLSPCRHAAQAGSSRGVAAAVRAGSTGVPWLRPGTLQPRYCGEGAAGQEGWRGPSVWVYVCAVGRKEAWDCWPRSCLGPDLPLPLPALSDHLPLWVAFNQPWRRCGSSRGRQICRGDRSLLHSGAWHAWVALEPAGVVGSPRGCTAWAHTLLLLSTCRPPGPVLSSTC